MRDESDDLTAGTRLEDFEIERELGAGGFGVTYLARDVRLGRRVAVKEYLPRDWGTRRRDGTVGPRSQSDAENYAWGLARFLEEAQVLARFDHPNVVRVHRVFEARRTAYLVTEYVEGRNGRAWSLADELKAAGTLPEARVRALLEALTSGLEPVHAVDLVHRDIKPANVMLRADGSPVLIDFGAARQLMGRHSRSVTSVLTPGYAPIEQYSTKGRQGPWTDIYALSAVAYAALSGRVPEDATERVPEDVLAPLSEAAAQPVSAGLASAVTAALAVYPEDRPQNLAAWLRPWKEAAIVGVPVVREPSRGAGNEADAVATDVGAPYVQSPREETAGRSAGLRGWAWGAGLVGLALFIAFGGSWNRSGSGDIEGVPVTNGAPATDRTPGGDGREDVSEQELGGGTPSEVRATGGDSGPRTVEPEGADDIPGENGSEVADAGTVESDVTSGISSPEEIEAALGLDRSARRAVQEGLAAAGFDPGPSDGWFGGATRAALGAWQASRGAPPTGYLTRAHVAVLRVAGNAAEQGLRRFDYAFPLNSSRQDSLDSAGADVVYRVTVPGSGLLAVSSTGYTDTYGELLSGSGNILVSNDDGGQGLNFSLSHSVSAGTYYVRVRHYNSDRIGDYRIIARFTEE